MIGTTANGVRYGEDLTRQASHIEWPEVLVCTMEEPWSLVQPRLGASPLQVHYVEETGIEYLRSLRVPPGTHRIVGVGGGTPIDSAKYLGWANGLPVTAIPTIASVDAMVTPAIAVRTRSIVKYIGNCAPEEVIVSYPVIQAAPMRLNRAGISDILSCHTAQFDWQLAEQRGRDVRDEAVSLSARKVMDRCIAEAAEIREVTAIGVKTLIDGYCVINDLTLSWGSARMEEGAEHFFAYNVERITRRHFVHGELVALGILLMSLHQGNAPESIKGILDRAGVAYRPEQVGVSRDELQEALVSLPEFVRDNRLWYSAIDDRPLDPQRLIGTLQELTG